MSGTRFARSGRCRFFVCLGVFVIMVLFVAIFHSSQLQLDESREQSRRCEQQQESLNEQIQSILQQKINVEKTLEHERKDQLVLQRNVEQKQKEGNEQHEKDQLQSRVRYEKSEQLYKLLQLKHDELQAECDKSKKQHLEDTNSFEKKLQALRSELQKDKNVQEGEVNVWKEKYNVLLTEKQHLEAQLKASKDVARATTLETIIAEYKQHCEYKPKLSASIVDNLFMNKPFTAQTTRNGKHHQPSFDKPHNEKSFNEQVEVSPGVYQIGVNSTNNNKNNSNITGQENTNIHGESGDAAQIKYEQMKPLIPFAARHNHSLILNSVENFQMVPKAFNKLSEETETQLRQQQPEDAPVAAALVAAGADKMVSPLSAPSKPTSTDAAKNAGAAQANLKQAPNATASSSSSSSVLPPLVQPPKPAAASERKLPENVAPIPDNFEDANKVDAADADTAAEDLQKNDNDEGKNNRYANVVDDLDTGKQQQQHRKSGAAAAAAAANEDSGAHEVKDHEFLNEPNFNLPGEEDNHFFDGGGMGIAAAAADKHDANIVDGDVAVADKAPAAAAGDNGVDDDDDDDLMANDADGDVAVKPAAQHLLDADNLNNEIAGDQGKEFADGLRMDDANEEDQDEDDYSNMAARKQGAEAIRN